jgi:hypothetical protein
MPMQPVMPISTALSAFSFSTAARTLRAPAAMPQLPSPNTSFISTPP